MELTSTAFKNGLNIPSKYGYNHENINPPLKIQNIPENTKSLFLIMDDPDALPAVGKIWLHWILWNISPEISEIPENSIPYNSVQGLNDFGEIGYGGPAPPDKEHTYLFKLYALDKTLSIEKNLSRTEIENEVKNHIITETLLTGKFSPS